MQLSMFPNIGRVDLKVETFCGVAKADTSLAPTSKTLIIRGDVAFGKLGIVYVKIKNLPIPLQNEESVIT